MKIPLNFVIIFLIISLLGFFSQIFGSVSTLLVHSASVKIIADITIINGIGSIVGSVSILFLAKILHNKKPVILYVLLILIGNGIVLSEQIALGYFIYCIGSTGIFSILHATIASDANSTTQRTRQLARLDVFFSVGALLAPLVISGLLTLKSAWQQPYIYFTIVFLIIGSVFIYTIPATQVAINYQNNANVFFKKPTLYAACCAVCLGICESSHYAWLTIYLVEQHDLSADLARFALTSLASGMFAARFFYAFIIKTFSNHIVFNVSTLLLILATAGLILTKDAYVLVICAFLSGFGLGGLLPVLLSTLMSFFTHHATSCSAIIIFFLMIGFISSGILTGQLVLAYGLSASYLLIIIAALLLLGIGQLLIQSVRPSLVTPSTNNAT